jgi:hypothetical protein
MGEPSPVVSRIAHRPSTHCPSPFGRASIEQSASASVRWSHASVICLHNVQRRQDDA